MKRRIGVWAYRRIGVYAVLVRIEALDRFAKHRHNADQDFLPG
jgi:hypothetical protein